MDNSKIPINIFLDLPKAFDTIDHNILLDKLIHYVLEGPKLKLFISYPTNRKQYVELGENRHWCPTGVCSSTAVVYNLH